MNKVLRRRLEMAERVRDFLRAHTTDGAPDEPGLVRLEQLVQRAQELAGQQRTGLVSGRSATQQRAEIKRVLESKLLRFLVAAGLVASRENIELAAHFHLPRSVSHQAFVTAARGMLEKATAQKDLLVKEGMSPALLDDLTAALSQFEQSLAASRAGRRAHVEASADLEAVVAEISERVRLLDGLVRYRFGDDPALMQGWFSARDVLGPFKQKAQSEPDASAGAGGAVDQTPRAA